MRACPKIPYPSPAAAARALQAVRSDPRRTEVGIHPCAACHAFHLTSDRKSAKQVDDYGDCCLRLAVNGFRWKRVARLRTSGSAGTY